MKHVILIVTLISLCALTVHGGAGGGGGAKAGGGGVKAAPVKGPGLKPGPQKGPPNKPPGWPANKPKPTGGGVKPRPTGGGVKPKPTGAGVKPKPTGGVKPKPTGGSAKPRPTGGSAKPKPTGGSAKPKPTGGSAKPKPTGGSAKPKPTGGSAKPVGPTKGEMGALSSKYETGGKGVSTVSSGMMGGGRPDPGGVSYGSYQMTSQPGGGRVSEFVKSKDFPAQFKGAFDGKTPGTKAYSDTWKSLAASNPQALHSAEHNFIQRTHYDPVAKSVQSKSGFDLSKSNPVLRDAVWSTAVQHGPGTSVVNNAFASMKAAGKFNPSSPSFNRDAINAIYDARTRANPRDSNRYANERATALQWLQNTPG